MLPEQRRRDELPASYALNIYPTFSMASGALSTEVLAAKLMRPMIGNSSQFLPRTIKEIVDSIEQTGTVEMLESHP